MAGDGKESHVLVLLFPFLVLRTISNGLDNNPELSDFRNSRLTSQASSYQQTECLIHMLNNLTRLKARWLLDPTRMFFSR